MTIYEERLAHDLDQIHTQLVEVALDVQKALEHSLNAVLTWDKKLANETILGDLAINRSIREIDARCHAFVARHLPSAGHLRFVSSVLRLTIEIERIGDYAATICRACVQLSDKADGPIIQEIKSIGLNSIQMFSEAIEAFNSKDADKALAVKSQSDMIERSFTTAFDEIIEEGNSGQRKLKDLFDLFIIVNRFERVADQAKNICEEIVFWLTGVTKPVKRYRIQFLDKAGDGRLQLALAYAHKSYPESAAYTADVNAVVDNVLTGVLEANGLDVANATKVDWVPGATDPPHVIVALSGKASEILDSFPFHSVVFDWDLLDPISSSLSDDERKQQYTSLLKDVSVRIRNLIESLRGEENAR